eukprot:5042097-Amphidinium_carterae.1
MGTANDYWWAPVQRGRRSPLERTNGQFRQGLAEHGFCKLCRRGGDRFRQLFLRPGTTNVNNVNAPLAPLEQRHRKHWALTEGV